MSTSTPKSIHTADIPARRSNGTGRRAQQAPIVFHDSRKIGKGRGRAEEDRFRGQERFESHFDAARKKFSMKKYIENRWKRANGADSKNFIIMSFWDPDLMGRVSFVGGMDGYYPERFPLRLLRPWKIVWGRQGRRGQVLETPPTLFPFISAVFF